jgi:hypothetical protein
MKAERRIIRAEAYTAYSCHLANAKRECLYTRRQLLALVTAQQTSRDKT